MNKLHLYILAAALASIGLLLFSYKAFVLGFPVKPATTATVWNVEARLKFLADDKPAKASMFLPSSSRKFAIVDEHFISGGFGFVASWDEGNRQATWAVRKAKGAKSIYYQAVVRRVHTKAPEPPSKAPEISPPQLEGTSLAAAKSLLAETKAKSADTTTFVGELIRRLNRPVQEENVKVLLRDKPTTDRKVRLAVRLLRYSGIPAREVNGISLQEGKHDFSKKVPIVHWIEVHDGTHWVSFDPTTGRSPVPEDWLLWWTGPKRLVSLEGGSNLNTLISVSPKIEEGLSAAVRRAEISKPFLLKFSLFGLPVNTQAVFKVMLLVPIGAFLLVILRNVVGIKTFGTFMPVLIALSFRETGLMRGVILFSVLVALGLSIRFYLERLKLLVVPRLAAVLIVVVGLMAVISIVAHRLGGHTGLSVALFPMVILTMTIERMSIVWEERGSYEALVSGIGSMLTAALAFLVMNIKLIEHLVFVFPELLLVLLAATLLMGRYTGYRLMDLYRFRELAKG